MARWKGNAVTFQTVPCMSASSDHVKFGGGVPKSGTYVLWIGTCPSNRTYIPNVCQLYMYVTIYVCSSHDDRAPSTYVGARVAMTTLQHTGHVWLRRSEDVTPSSEKSLTAAVRIRN